MSTQGSGTAQAVRCMVCAIADGRAAAVSSTPQRGFTTSWTWGGAAARLPPG